MNHLAIIGSTGLVGQELLSLLCSSSLEIKKISCFASKKSIGKTCFFRKKEIPIKELKPNSLKGIDVAFFCAGSKISEQYIPEARKQNVICIDLSSHYRNDPKVPLIIPEINPNKILDHKGLISSPNCTTTLMLLVLFPLHKTFGLKNIITSTYQAASGGGKKLLNQLLKETKDFFSEPKTSYNSYGFNLFLHDSNLDSDGYCDEEKKMIKETHKILNDPSINISATCVRVPIIRAHSLSINVSFHKTPSILQARNLIKKMKGVILLEDFEKNRFPTPFDATNKKEVFCGRIRQDPQTKNLELWVVGDQLLKGAALNAFQIAELLEN